MTFMEIVDEVIKEELEIIEEVIKEEIEPILKQQQEMERKAFNKDYAELIKAEKELGG